MPKIFVALLLMISAMQSYGQKLPPIVDNTKGCESNIAIVLDESGSISSDEAAKIREGLMAFINSELNSDMTISLIGMSDTDNNTRKDAYLENKVTAATLPHFQKWITAYRARSGTGISAQSDYWASGLQVVLENLKQTPDIVIVVTDGSQAKNSDVLKSRMNTINKISHLYVYGIDPGVYVNSGSGGSSGGIGIIIAAPKKTQKTTDPNLAADKGDTKANGSLKESLAFLLEREPISSQVDLMNSDYFAYDTFSKLKDGLSNLSNDLVNSGVGCDNCTDKNPESELIKNLFVDLLRYIISKIQSGSTASDLEGLVPAQLVALQPYITDVGKIGLYDFYILSNGGFSFSFISHGPNGYRNPDIQFVPSNHISSINTSTFDPVFDLDAYVSPDIALTYSGIEMYPRSKDYIKFMQIKHIDFCPDKPVKDENSFCTSQMGVDGFPTIADLTPGGPNIQWYLTETGGTALPLDEELIEEAEDPTGAVYWWDDITDGTTTRTSITAYVNQGVLDADLYDYQEFPEGTSPTIGDLEPATGVQWYSSPTGGSPLSSSTTLTNGAIYYAQEIGGVTCRLAVEIFIGTNPPLGDGVQYLCEGQTLADVDIETEDPSYTIRWYANETGGSQLPLSTVLANGTTYYVAQVDGSGNESTERYAVTIFLTPVMSPIVPFPVQEFYNNPLDPPTVADLLAFGTGIQWYATPTGGTVYDPLELLVDGQTYYAEQNIGLCPSDRVPVTVDILDQAGPDLLGCEKFKPQFGDRYVINAWVREQAVVPVNPEVKQFNNSEFSELFVDLLTHLLELTKSVDPMLHDIPQEYIPTSATESLNFDPLLPFVKDTDIGERKLTVYDFTSLTDDYGRTIGFEFWLNAGRTSKVVYKSPLVSGETYHYPILDNVAFQTLEFTDVYTQGSALIIKSNFASTGTPSQTNTNTLYSNSISAVESEVTFYDYEEVEGFQPMDYANALVELEYKDVDRNVITIDDEYIKFRPQGEIIDGWQRIAADFIIPLNAAQMTISLVNGSDNLAYFDDIRMHPHNSNMKTYVYDPVTQRLMSELDENNYATFYEYDEEGGLVRVKKETEKGIYTIQETRSGTTKTPQ